MARQIGRNFSYSVCDLCTGPAFRCRDFVVCDWRGFYMKKTPFPVGLVIIIVFLMLAEKTQVLEKIQEGWKKESSSSVGDGILTRSGRVLGSVIESFTPEYIEPPEPFMQSIILTPDGINSFPFGQHSVSEFVSRLSKIQRADGQHPEIHGWTDSDNGYTLHVSFGDKEAEAIFVREGRDKGRSYSGLSYRIDGEERNPLILMYAVFAM